MASYLLNAFIPILFLLLVVTEFTEVSGENEKMLVQEANGASEKYFFALFRAQFDLKTKIKLSLLFLANSPQKL